MWSFTFQILCGVVSNVELSLVSSSKALPKRFSLHIIESIRTEGACWALDQFQEVLMLDTLFPTVSKRCLRLPLFGQVMEDFTDWLVQQDYARLHIRAMLRVVRKMDRHWRRKGVHRIEEITSPALDSYWQTLRRRLPWEAGTVRIMGRFLRMRGVLHSCQLRTPTALQLADYSAYLRDVRGLASGTISEQLRVAAQLLAHLDFDNATRRLSAISTGDIELFLQKLSESLSRATLQARVTSVRNFLRFLAASGKVPPGLAEQIDSPRVYKHEKLPRTLPWKTVQALLRSIPRNSAMGRRDYTALFLMATYGLRSCEVAALTLDDVDWRAGLLRIPQSKTRNVLDLPLTDPAARVLIEYLRRVPRPSGYRNLFFRVRAPIGALTRESLREAFQSRCRRSGLDIPFQGPHCLRHSYAVHLLRQGTALKTIGDLLGHQHPETTAGYLRLATEDLRDVGLSVPRTTRQKGGLS
jgi:integrase/recombinase XerD